MSWTLYVNGSVSGSFQYGCAVENCSISGGKPPAWNGAQYGSTGSFDGVNHNDTWRGFLPTAMPPNGIGGSDPGGMDRYQQRLFRFFEEFDPAMIQHVRPMLKKWKGREDELFALLRKTYPAVDGVPSGRPSNLQAQDATLEGGPWNNANGPEPVLNAGGVDPRTRDSPFMCDSRIHGVNVCHLPWGSNGHHTVPNLYLARGVHKHLVLHGVLDDVRVWRVARTAAQIKASMDVELGGGEEGLLAYWPANEGHGVMAYDKTSLQSTKNLHLLGKPSEMWKNVATSYVVVSVELSLVQVQHRLFSPFTESRVECGRRCAVHIVPPPLTRFHHNSSLQVASDRMTTKVCSRSICTTDSTNCSPHLPMP